MGFQKWNKKKMKARFSHQTVSSRLLNNIYNPFFGANNFHPTRIFSGFSRLNEIDNRANCFQLLNNLAVSLLCIVNLIINTSSKKNKLTESCFRVTTWLGSSRSWDCVQQFLSSEMIFMYVFCLGKRSSRLLNFVTTVIYLFASFLIFYW